MPHAGRCHIQTVKYHTCEVKPSRQLKLNFAHRETLERRPRSDLTAAGVGTNVARQLNLFCSTGFSNNLQNPHRGVLFR